MAAPRARENTKEKAEHKTTAVQGTLSMHNTTTIMCISAASALAASTLQPGPALLCQHLPPLLCHVLSCPGKGNVLSLPRICKLLESKHWIRTNPWKKELNWTIIVHSRKWKLGRRFWQLLTALCYMIREAWKVRVSIHLLHDHSSFGNLIHQSPQLYLLNVICVFKQIDFDNSKIFVIK